MQQNTAFWYLFDSIIREVDSTNVVEGHLLLGPIDKEFDKKETQFDCFDGSYIRGFGNARH